MQARQDGVRTDSKYLTRYDMIQHQDDKVLRSAMDLLFVISEKNTQYQQEQIQE